MLRYFISILLVLAGFNAMAQDDEADDAPKSAVRDSFSQLRIEADIYKPITNYFSKDKKSYEFAVDYYHKKDLYFVAEGGWGRASFNNASLNYSSSNIFFKAGINKSILLRLSSRDWDMASIGVRYAVGLVDRGAANYTITNTIWGQTTGITPAKKYTGHWIEITGGTRIELYKGIFIGWTARGKFLMNQKPFKELPPSYMAGYGKGDKNSVFDFNVYLCYAIRWKRNVDVKTDKK